MNGGYIKLFRSLLSWEWYKDIPTKVLWIHILLNASFEDQKYKGIDVPRGSLLTSVRELADQTGLTERKIRTALVHLQNSQNLTQKATNKGTLITIENYTFFQGMPAQSDTQSDEQPTHDRHTTDTPIVKEGKNVRVNITKEVIDTNNNNYIYNNKSVLNTKDCARACEELEPVSQAVQAVQEVAQEMVQAPGKSREEIEARIQAKIAAWQRGEDPR